tara:strand:+ start:228 stop:506 length:279 start_codon:yes stop_codon:yes gene_type:complete
MEKELNSILQILEKATTTEDVTELNQIEEKLQYFIKIINNNINSDSLLSKNTETSNRLEKLKDLISKLESNKNLNNELFLEFKQFIENRKFK